MDDSGEGLGTFNSFINKFRSRIIGVARKILWILNCVNPDAHAEDIESEVLKKIYANWDRLDSPERALYRIIANAASDHARECRTQVAMDIEEGVIPCFVEAGNDPEEALYEAILLDELLAHLNDRERAIIELTLDGHNSTVIGEILGMPSATVRVTRMRAMGKLRRLNEGYDGASDVAPAFK